MPIHHLLILTQSELSDAFDFMVVVETKLILIF